MESTTLKSVIADATSSLTTLASPEEVLVVIDMQSFFPASNSPSTIAAVVREVKTAVARNLPVIIVEYDPTEIGRTHDRILRVIANYPRAVTITKAAADGSREIMEACLINGLSLDELRVCGINSDACILETVEGYHNLVPTSTITIVRDACNCLTGPANNVWREDFPSLPNVIVLEGA